MLQNVVQDLATAAEIEQLERHEVVGGEIVEKASPTARHSYIQSNLIADLQPFQQRRGGRGPGGWWILSECTVELERHEVYQPDIAGWRAERMPRLPEEFPVRIAPDWVCEVLSPTTAARDLHVKRRSYHRARVGHYWVVDPLNLTLSVLRWRDDEYALILAARPGALVRAEPFEEIAIDVASLLGSA